MPKPFLKWVGGKARLLPEIAKRLPDDYYERRHVEPFLGGGAVFLGLRKPGQRALASDLNCPLISTWRAVVSGEPGLDQALREHEAKHTDEHYYATRKWLNEHRGSATLSEEAAAFCYLNRACFNGLWRENRKGEMNTPRGSYKQVRLPGPEELARIKTFVDASAVVVYASYQTALMSIAPDDFLYLDPPYDKAKGSDFDAYVGGGFDQAELARRCRALPAGSKFMLSNADTPRVRELYAGFNVEAVEAPRSVGGARRKAAEVLVTNY